jgi:hypothetical protein
MHILSLEDVFDEVVMMVDAHKANETALGRGAHEAYQHVAEMISRVDRCDVDELHRRVAAWIGTRPLILLLIPTALLTL